MEPLNTGPDNDYLTLQYACSVCGFKRSVKAERGNVYRTMLMDCPNCRRPRRTSSKPMFTDYVCLDEPENGFKGDIQPIHVVDPAKEFEALKNALNQSQEEPPSCEIAVVDK